MSMLIVAADTYTLTTGRLVATAATLVALAGVVVGGLTLARARGRVGRGRTGAIAALTTGLVGMAVGAVVVAAAKGGPGTGYGIVGGYFALAIGLIAAVLGWLALSRARRTV